MAELNVLESNEDLEQVWRQSVEGPVLLFKHSTTCPISAGAYKEYQSFLESAGDNLDSFLVKVIENKDISNRIAEETNVKHESPQIFLISDKDVVWHTSHSNITAESISHALQQAK